MTEFVNLATFDFLAEVERIEQEERDAQPPTATYTYVADGALSVPTGDGYSVVLERGMTLSLSSELIEASRDRKGHSWLEFIDADVRFQKGEPPADLREELERAAAETAEAARIDELREARRYGKKTPGPSAETLERVAEHVQWAASVRSSKEI